MIKEVKSVDISYINSLLHGGKGSGRWPKGSSGWDGDGDGIVDDKHNQAKAKEAEKKALEDINEETKKVNQINANIKAKQEYARLTTPQSDAGKSITKTGEAVATLGKQVGEAPFGESGHKEYAKYENLNDEELRRKINRLKSEREYSDLTGDTKYVKTGKDKAREILQTLGAVLGIVGTGVTIIATIKNIRGQKVQQSEDLGIDSLMHYGVKGMKWGTRKEPEETSTTKKVKKQKEYSDEKSEEERQKEKRRKIAIAATVALGATALIAIGIKKNSVINDQQNKIIAANSEKEALIKTVESKEKSLNWYKTRYTNMKMNSPKTKQASSAGKEFLKSMTVNSKFYKGK